MTLDKYKFMFTIVMISFLLLSSCDLSGSSDNPQLTNPDLYTGTKGLEMEVVNEIPNSIYENEPLEYILKLTNEGVYDITDGIVSMNVEEGYLNVNGKNSKKEKFSLKGKEIFQTLDDFEIFQFNLRSGKLDDTSQSHDAIILVNACYDYMGKVYTDICIDSDPHNINPTQKECTSKNINLGSGQGGPIVVSEIETRMLIDGSYLRPQFKIKITNTGKGTVLLGGNENAICSSSDIPRDLYNKVRLFDISFSDFHKRDFDCTPEPLNLRNNEDTITCTLNLGKLRSDITNYLTPLYLELRYGYMITRSDSVKIEKILTS